MSALLCYFSLSLFAVVFIYCAGELGATDDEREDSVEWEG